MSAGPAATPDPAAAGTMPAAPSTTASAPSAPSDASTAPASAPATGTAMASNAAPGQVVGDMSQQNPAPAKYPACTSQKQDRCVVTAQLKHHVTMAKAKTAKTTTHTGA